MWDGQEGVLELVLVAHVVAHAVVEQHALRDLDRVREILQNHQHSVWTGKGESQEQWSLIEKARDLIDACRDQERDLSKNTQSLEDLINFYVTSLREVDRIQREFEQVTAS